MFGRTELIELLISSWNKLASERDELIHYASVDGGFNYLVVLHRIRPDLRSELFVYFVDTERRGKQLLPSLEANTSSATVFKCLGPYPRSLGQNLGLAKHQDWMDVLYPQKRVADVSA